MIVSIAKKITFHVLILIVSVNFLGTSELCADNPILRDLNNIEKNVPYKKTVEKRPRSKSI